ncbi:PEP-CTERM sorting domain-containing protein [Pseudocolwellia agarivorans]|uniref:PEP-CTERM sorting domain-containing protein n=1 Tax=Pseudocolwellia agarivorans TaxID=1911682 RepID=UPI0009875F17|nr:PEP-CTERM sorting domain-containing protein [Pseudocolwellia agarivorans]
MKFLKVVLILSVTSFANMASAGLVFYTSDSSSNSVNWTSDVLADGYQINNNVNFDSHALGLLDSGLYLGSDGISITSTGSNNQTIKDGAGVIDGNTTGAIPGEGVHQSSKYLEINNTGVLTLSFTSGAFAAGIGTFDVWTGGDFTISVFSGVNGTGSLLGSLSGVAEGLNFQNLGTFFMGVKTDDGSKFGSIAFDFSADGNDDIGYDDILFASNSLQVSVPEPSTLVIFALGVFVLTTRKLQK